MTCRQCRETLAQQQRVVTSQKSRIDPNKSKLLNTGCLRAKARASSAVSILARWSSVNMPHTSQQTWRSCISVNNWETGQHYNLMTEHMTFNNNTVEPAVGTPAIVNRSHAAVVDDVADAITGNPATLFANVAVTV